MRRLSALLATLALGLAEQPDQPSPPIDTPTPMVVYPDEPRDPLGFYKH